MPRRERSTTQHFIPPEAALGAALLFLLALGATAQLARESQKPRLVLAIATVAGLTLLYLFASNLDLVDPVHKRWRRAQDG